MMLQGIQQIKDQLFEALLSLRSRLSFQCLDRENILENSILVTIGSQSKGPFARHLYNTSRRMMEIVISLSSLWFFNSWCCYNTTYSNLQNNLRIMILGDLHNRDPFHILFQKKVQKNTRLTAKRLERHKSFLQFYMSLFIESNKAFTLQ